jgi:DnaJ-class molecular chaperone
MADSKVSCPDCGGRGWIPFATEEVTCATCEGKGSVTSKVAQQVSDEKTP